MYLPAVLNDAVSRKKIEIIWTSAGNGLTLYIIEAGIACLSV
jgi:hypothetical protein